MGIRLSSGRCRGALKGGWFMTGRKYTHHGSCRLAGHHSSEVSLTFSFRMEDALHCRRFFRESRPVASAFRGCGCLHCIREQDSFKVVLHVGCDLEAFRSCMKRIVDMRTQCSEQDVLLSWIRLFRVFSCEKSMRRSSRPPRC